MTAMEKQQKAARIILEAWRTRRAIDALPDDCLPSDIDAGYRVQDALVEAAGEPVVGYKIAATAKAGQAHLQIDHPIAGRLFKSRVFSDDGVTVPLTGSRMSLLETEFAFVFGTDLPLRESAYDWRQVMDHVAALHPAIELPDSRFLDVAGAGAPQLIADNACTDWFVLGPEAPETWRDLDLAAQLTALYVNGSEKTRGHGGDALGDPRFALTWLANHLSSRGIALKAGDMVTTGVCGQPTPAKPGDEAVADFGDLGQVSIRLG
ncbi:MAG: fumarylacetoacetate hydrolase family protein [Hyphomicrobiales bacterium]|nr:fumarylacetoacetate hydrolase family protein [Hyphomicrobiales bacterium]